MRRISPSVWPVIQSIARLSAWLSVWIVGAGCVAALPLTVPALVGTAALGGAAVGAQATQISQTWEPRHVSVESVPRDQVLVACREAMAYHQIAETRLEFSPEETTLFGRSTNQVSITFHLRPRRVTKTILLIEVQPPGKGVTSGLLFRTVRKSMATRTSAKR